MTRRKRVLVYAQHLSGVGHHVRAEALAAALAARHQVYFAHGGRPVPRPERASGVEPIALPALRRGPDGLEPVEPGRSARELLRERSEMLRRAASRIAPDVVLVEHYPFSKWELEDEVEALAGAARRANPQLELVCSIRDVMRRTRHEPGPEADHARRVVSTLNRRFAALLIHADPAFTRLEEHFAAAGEIEIPVVYTGFVSEKPGPRSEGADERRRLRGSGGYALLSCGGGAGSFEMVARVARAWGRLAASGAAGGRVLVICEGLFWSERERTALRECTAGGPLALRPFGPDFLGWMQDADLSISRAGYNTCVNVLETRRPALLLPNPRMSDQRFRARRLAELGLADPVVPEGASHEGLAERIGAALRRDPPRHALDLSGAERTCALLADRDGFS